MAKGKVLHDPIKPRQKKSSWNFAGPSKEQATTGRWMPGGDDYGVGFRVNVGKKKARGIYEGPIPFGCDKFDPSEAID